MSYKKRFSYRFDTFLAKGGVSIFVSLLLVFLVIFILLVAFRGILLWYYPVEIMCLQHDLGFWGNAYITFLELTDPGNMALDIGSSPWYKLIGIIAGISGLILFSMLIAFITTAMNQKLNELKRGHSKVIEKGHTLILGWNEERVVEIIKELIIANKSEKDACVVILAKKDKEEMDAILRLRLTDTQSTRIVTRSGNTPSLINLDLVSVGTCKSVIILAECDAIDTENEKTTSDAKVIQTVMALTSIKENEEDFCIVVEIFNSKHRGIIKETFAKSVVTVDAGNILAKLLVQVSRSVGLSIVYNEILSFEGSEMYFHLANWGGITFQDLAFRYLDGVPLGLRHSNGSLSLNPDIYYQLKQDDEVLILANDDSTIGFSNKPVAIPEEIKLAGLQHEQHVEKELILGWTHNLPTILQEYADYVKSGSRIDIMLPFPNDRARREIKAANESLEGIEISLLEKDPLDIEELIYLKPYTYDNIVILAEGGRNTDAHKVDSENIVTLLLLRYVFEKYSPENNDTKLITEILNSQNYPLISRAGVNDVIISNRLISMVLAQISESRNIKDVYDKLFKESGSEIYLKPASLYFGSFHKKVSFASIIKIAQQRKEICLGVKIKSLEEDGSHNYGIELTPDKTSVFNLKAEDSLVVLAENAF
jgi:ion channel POLLUX/CASTOR